MFHNPFVNFHFMQDMPMVSIPMSFMNQIFYILLLLFPDTGPVSLLKTCVINICTNAKCATIYIHLCMYVMQNTYIVHL